MAQNERASDNEDEWESLPGVTDTHPSTSLADAEPTDELTDEQWSDYVSGRSIRDDDPSTHPIGCTCIFCIPGA